MGNKSTEEIAGNIINLANELKSGHNEIIVSSIIMRNDKMNAKGVEVNNLLKFKCSENSYLFCGSPAN